MQDFHCADHSKFRASEVSILVGYGVWETIPFLLHGS